MADRTDVAEQVLNKIDKDLRSFDEVIAVHTDVHPVEETDEETILHLSTHAWIVLPAEEEG
jgi:hypothetical protein